MNNIKGFTLFELMLVSAIMILLAAFAIPGFANLMSRSEIDSQATQLMATVKTAREKSINDKENIVLCGKSENNECSRDWSLGYLLFTDNNNDNQFNADVDQLLYTHAYNNPDITVTWRSFRASQPIRFLPAGITWHNNGTFIICLERQNQLSKALFIAKTGRIEMSKDENHDGIHEDRNGDALQCS